ncbi:MAG: hypothetical protein D8M26_01220 [Ignavibacteriae bacterium]|nr:MAG: hypothetical protein EDM72_14185 [Chlorobiota bacterium]MBL1121490.1 hypothetical protein [Ignavibacteriota bacterium]MCE7855786.1 hypothetical protein [Ignavibacteria bacterium CHB3]
MVPLRLKIQMKHSSLIISRQVQKKDIICLHSKINLEDGHSLTQKTICQLMIILGTYELEQDW